MAVPLERNQDATLYVGGLDEKVNEAILWELMVQVRLKIYSLILKKILDSGRAGYECEHAQGQSYGESSGVGFSKSTKKKRF